MIDLGHDHTLRWFEWDPDPELNPQYADLPALEPGQHVGAIVAHKKPDGSPCEGAIHFDTPRTRRLDSDSPLWQVQSWEPLTISPSVACTECGDHGHIHEGKWVPA